MARAVVPPPRVIMGKAPSPTSSAPPATRQLSAVQAPAAPGALRPVVAESKPPEPVSVPPAAIWLQAGAAWPLPPQAAAAQAEPAKGAFEASRAAVPAPVTAAAGQAPPSEADAGAAKTSRDRARILAACQSLESERQGNAEEPSQAATGGGCHLGSFVFGPFTVWVHKLNWPDGSCLLGCVCTQTQWCAQLQLQGRAGCPCEAGG